MITAVLLSVVAILGAAVIRFAKESGKDKEQVRQREEALEDANDLLELRTDDDVVSSLREKAERKRRKGNGILGISNVPRR